LQNKLAIFVVQCIISHIFFLSSLSCIWFILCYESTIGKNLIKSNKNATHAPTSTQTPCNNNLPAHTTTSTPRDKHARKGYCKKKKPSKNIFFAKYRHIMLFLQKILFPKKSVTDLPLNRMHTVQNVYLATVPFSFATQWC
jgi:hypothetical protein